MKENYKRPLFEVEEFVANQVVAACHSTNMATYCLQGPNTDRYGVVSNTIDGSNCDVNAAIANDVVGAIKPNSPNGSTGTSYGSKWGYTGRYYQTPSGANALLYFCMKNDNIRSVDIKQWDIINHTEGKVLVHNTTADHQRWHCEVIGVNSSTVSSV